MQAHPKSSEIYVTPQVEPERNLQMEFIREYVRRKGWQGRCHGKVNGW